MFGKIVFLCKICNDLLVKFFNSYCIFLFVFVLIKDINKLIFKKKWLYVMSYFIVMCGVIVWNIKMNLFKLSIY